MFTFGANPPPGREWMLGKTVAEINAIQEEADATGVSETVVVTGNAWKKRLVAKTSAEDT